MQGAKLNGMQQMLLNMLGGPDGIARLFKSLLNGLDPVETINGIKGSFDGIQSRLAVVEQRQIQLGRAIAAAFPEIAARPEFASLAGGNPAAGGHGTATDPGGRAVAHPGVAGQRPGANGVDHRQP